MTVSQALRGVGRFSPQTQQRIRETAERLGYRPNVAARAIRTGRTGVIALLTASGSDRTILPKILKDGIFDALSARGQQLLLTQLTRQQVKQSEYVPLPLRQVGVDGVIVDCTVSLPPQLMQMVDEYALPTVWLGCQRRHDAVYTDEHAAARQAVNMLIERGHRDIAYADYHNGTAAPDHPSGEDRRAGYVAAMEQAGLAVRFLSDIEQLSEAMQHQPTDFHGGRRLRYSIQWMSRSDCPTAVVAHGHETAIPIVVATGYTGRHFPDELSLMTFGETLWQTSISVDTMTHPGSALGRAAVEMLMSKVENGDQPLPSRMVACQHRVGHTLGRARGFSVKDHEIFAAMSAKQNA